MVSHPDPLLPQLCQSCYLSRLMWACRTLGPASDHTASRANGLSFGTNYRAFKEITSTLDNQNVQGITLLTKVHIIKAMVSPVVTYRCERWTIKKTEHQRMYAFELWCWRRLLRVPWPAKRPNQSNLKKINPEYSLEGLKLKLQYFGHLMQRAESLEKAQRHTGGKLKGEKLKAGGQRGNRG